MSLNGLKGIRIVSDGTVLGTKLYSPTGEELKEARVRAVTWTHKAGDIPSATIEVLMPELDVTVLSSEAVEAVEVVSAKIEIE